MASVIITYTDNGVDPSTRYVASWNGSAFTDCTDPLLAQPYDDVTDATTISSIEAAITSAKGSTSNPTTTPNPRHPH